MVGVSLFRRHCNAMMSAPNGRSGRLHWQTCGRNNLHGRPALSRWCPEQSATRRKRIANTINLPPTLTTQVLSAMRFKFSFWSVLWIRSPFVPARVLVATTYTTLQHAQEWRVRCSAHPWFCTAKLIWIFISGQSKNSIKIYKLLDVWEAI